VQDIEECLAHTILRGANLPLGHLYVVAFGCTGNDSHTKEREPRRGNARTPRWKGVKKLSFFGRGDKLFFYLRFRDGEEQGVALLGEHLPADDGALYADKGDKYIVAVRGFGNAQQLVGFGEGVFFL